jgi:hypothetical protein
MGIFDAILGNLLGGLGKKAAQWIPSKEELMRRKIDGYKNRLKEIEALPWTAALGREHSDITRKLSAEEANLERYLSANR